MAADEKMEVTVKTLDSQSRTFAVDAEVCLQRVDCNYWVCEEPKYISLRHVALGLIHTDI